MALYIGGTDNKAQYVAGMYYGDSDNKPARVVAAWIGDENNQPRLFYSPGITFDVDAYGADWYGGQYYINITNVRGGTGRYVYQIHFTGEGGATAVYPEDSEPVRETSCSCSFTIPSSGSYAEWEVTITDASSAHCYGTKSGRLDVVAAAMGIQRYSGSISQHDNGYWLVTIYSDVLKDAISTAQVSISDTDGNSPEYYGAEYVPELGSNAVWFLGNRIGTYQLTSLTLTNSRGITASASSDETITVSAKAKTVYNVVNFNGRCPDIYNSTEDDTPSAVNYSVVYNVSRLNSSWYHFNGSLEYRDGEWWDQGSCGDQYIKAADFSYSIDSSWTVYYE